MSLKEKEQDGQDVNICNFQEQEEEKEERGPDLGVKVQDSKHIQQWRLRNSWEADKQQYTGKVWGAQRMSYKAQDVRERCSDFAQCTEEIEEERRKGGKEPTLF